MVAIPIEVQAFVLVTIIFAYEALTVWLGWLSAYRREDDLEHPSPH